MTYDKYKNVHHPTPYLFTLKSGSNFVYYFGEKHSFDPDHPQWSDEKEFWNKFLEDTRDKKRIVFIEGGKRPVEADENQSILKHGGMGLVTYLAHEAQIETFSPEPDEKYERSEMEKEFSREEIQYYYFARIVHQWSKKQDPKPDFKEYVNGYLEGDKKESGWVDFDFSLEAMKKIHSNLFNKLFDENDTNLFYDAITPVELNTMVNKVSRASSQIRDQYIVQQICDYVSKGYSIYLQYGASHAVMQEPLLKELLLH